MTKDAQMIAESYKVVREQQLGSFGVAKPQQAQPTQSQLGGFGVAKPQQPVQPPITQTQQNAPAPAQPAKKEEAPMPKATKEQEKAVNDLLKAFGLPDSAAPYLLQSLIQGVPALKQQYGL